MCNVHIRSQPEPITLTGCIAMEMWQWAISWYFVMSIRTQRKLKPSEMFQFLLFYRKRPCISRTFFTKLKPKIEGAAYPWIHLCLEFSKTYLILIKLLTVPRKKHKRNCERVAVVKGVFKCLSANLALQKFLQAIHFRFTGTNKRLQPVTATSDIVPQNSRVFAR